MAELDLDDLEQYLLDCSFEESQTPLIDKYFDQCEPLLLRWPTECLHQLILAGKFNTVELPPSSFYIPRINESGEAVFTWDRSYAQALFGTEVFAPPLNQEGLEAILSAPTFGAMPSSVNAAIEVFNQHFDPNTHPLHSFIHQKEEDQDDDEDFVVQPDLQREEDTNAIVDKLDVTEYARLVPHPAIQYPFELDEFQKRATYRIECEQNVFVAAHTSAGKTVVAEYAIARCQQRLSRVIYTSPIKALSNQKFRDFKNLFKDVGIVTGDVSVDPDSFCVIMTTEILRSMLYNNSGRVKELEWVILDEVHYINDQDRGVVWEEVLIMLPAHVRVVMLSATVPNFLEFSSWVGRVRQQPVYVQCTYHRPVPLEHSIYVPDTFLTILTVDGQLDLSEYDQLPQICENLEYSRAKDTYYCKHLVKQLITQNLLPCVLFDFSRDRVDKRAESLTTLQLVTKGESFKINKFAERALKRLNPVDRELPQIQFVQRLLGAGIGVHHSGILPILKEIVEILFAKGLIKVLVATETFGMGVNMPTKTVVLTNIQKFDGSGNRFLLPGEYTQMCGRAGRRGMDSKGNVIIFFPSASKLPEATVITTMTKAEPLSLESKFRVRYGQICSILLLDELELSDLAKNSFLENSSVQQQRLQAEGRVILEKKSADLVNYIESIPNAQFYKEFYQLLQHRVAVNTITLFEIIRVGSIIEVLVDSANFPALVQNVTHRINCLVFDFDNTRADFDRVNDHLSVKSLQIEHEKVLICFEERIPDIKLMIIRGQSLSADQIIDLAQYIIVGRTTPAELSVLPNMTETEELRSYMHYLRQHPVFASPDRYTALYAIAKLSECQKQLAANSQDQQLATEEQFNKRIQVLQRFNYINSQLIVELKGRALSAISSDYSLCIAESLFRGFWVKLTPSELAGLLSVFVCTERSDAEASGLTPELQEALDNTRNLFKEVEEAEESLALKVDSRFMDSLVEVTYFWANGLSFAELCGMTQVKEGRIVATIVQLHELVTSIISAAVILGEPATRNNLKRVQAMIKRDIIFANSLYISQ